MIVLRMKPSSMAGEVQKARLEAFWEGVRKKLMLKWPD